ncbi:MAG: sigma 54-interacting transcriptional regulator [Candidatus Omnitrophica bacterium]|nr:sigma 54-interacting transcriptional regulator [Candidatus Omnitrophota bacterium]
MSEKLHIEFKDLIGTSSAIQNVREIASKIAPHKITVLIEGETGTGKEWLARAVHLASPRTDREFVSIDCSSFSDAFLEAELFGYLRGSFAGAIHDKKGLLELADGGTVFLDHISKMSLTLQGKLVRVLNSGVFYKIGGVAEVHVDLRFVLATEVDLKAQVAKGKFRDDLYYQLTAMRIMMPPLRERGEDVIQFAEHFLDGIAKRTGGGRKTLTNEARILLKSYPWPGNIRELERELEKANALSGEHSEIERVHLSPAISKKKQSIRTEAHGVLTGSLKDQKRKVIALLERESIREALKKTDGNRTRAAELLAISRQELIRKVAAYKIKA